MEVIKPILKAIKNVLYSWFDSDMEVMSREAKRIFSNEEDSEKYSDAVFKLKNPEIESVTITLSTGEKITLIS